jgi:hypothetical protein
MDDHGGEKSRIIRGLRRGSMLEYTPSRRMAPLKQRQGKQIGLSEAVGDPSLNPRPSPEKTTIPANPVALRNIQIPPSAQQFL